MSAESPKIGECTYCNRAPLPPAKFEKDAKNHTTCPACLKRLRPVHEAFEKLERLQDSYDRVRKFNAAIKETD